MPRWTCTKCGRSLSRPNIWHQCLQRPVEAPFERKDPEVLELFHALQQVVARWQDVAYSATKNCVVYVCRGTFMVVRPMKKALDIKLYLKEETDEFPVYKVTRWGKRLEHHIRLFEPGDLDESVIALLQRAYNEDLQSHAL